VFLTPQTTLQTTQSYQHVIIKEWISELERVDTGQICIFMEPHILNEAKV